MPPEHFKFGGGLDQTMLHPLVLMAMLLVIVMMFGLRRKYLIAPFLLIAFLVPPGQQLVITGFHIFVLRVVVLAGLIRMCVSGRVSGASRFPGGFDTFDKLFVAWVFLHAMAFVLLFSQMGAVINQIGYVWDSVGAFFVLRYLIRDDKDVDRAIRTFALISAVVAAGMLTEHLRHLNVFGLLGGVRVEPELRNGYARAQGPFGHPLLAGTFGAILLPLFFWLWRRGHSKATGALGVTSSTLIVILAGSSTPLLAYGAGLGAVCMWALRARMRMVRWGIVVALLALHMVMKAPVWFLIARIGVVGGSSSDHRAYLVDLFIRHIGDWWLLGTDSNANWGWDMWDTANQYVSEGWSGGLAAFICFVVLIAVAFKRVGIARKFVAGQRKREWYYWLLGAAVFANAVAFFGISYFDQTRVAWFALLAMISAATLPSRQRQNSRGTVRKEAISDSSPSSATDAVAPAFNGYHPDIQEEVPPSRMLRSQLAD